MVSAKSIVGVFCYIFLMILGLQTFSDIVNKGESTRSMLVFTVSAIALILLGTYLIKMGEKEDEAKRAEKTRKKILKNMGRVNKLK